MFTFINKVKKLFVLNNYKRAFIIIKREGFKTFFEKLKNKLFFKEYDYNLWLYQHIPDEQELKYQRSYKFKYKPLLSLICPVYNTDPRLLKEMIQSVINQSYSNWELCIANGSTDNKDVNNILDLYRKEDKRIKVINLKENIGISGNSNAALKLATGDYVCLIDHDDVISPNALFEVVSSIQNTKHDFIYSDEDFISEDSSEFLAPSLKPDWSPDLFCTHNYITHFASIKKQLIDKVKGFDSAYDGAQDYDLFFKCTEIAKSIYHIPKVLYHWRICENSVASDSNNKLYAYEAGKKAIEAHLNRCNIDGEVSMMNTLGFYHVNYSTIGNPLVSIIIPNKDHIKDLKKCLSSVINKNTYKNYEIIICENNSKERKTFEYYEYLKENYKHVKILKYKEKGFNYSKINNYAAKHAKGQYLLFLNNDTELINPDSISNMLGLCMLSHVGIVGAKLLYKDKTVQHAGVVLGFGGAAGHVFHGIGKDTPGYKMRAILTCNYSAVTAACLMMSKKLFDKVNGFDESFTVAYNDVDLCLKVFSLNKNIVYEPESLWFHHESKSRGYEDSTEKIVRVNSEISMLQSKWGELLEQGDPFYNINFPIDYNPYWLRPENKKPVIHFNKNIECPVKVIDEEERKLYIDKIYYKYNTNSIYLYGWCSLPDKNLAFSCKSMTCFERDDLKNLKGKYNKVGFIKSFKINSSLQSYYEINIFNSYYLKISLDAIKALIDKSNNLQNKVDSFYGSSLLEDSVKEYQRNRYKETRNFHNKLDNKLKDDYLYLFNINDRDAISKLKNNNSKWVLFIDDRVSLDSNNISNALNKAETSTIVFSYFAYYQNSFIATILREKNTYMLENKKYSLYGVAIKSEEIINCSSMSDIYGVIERLYHNNEITYFDKPFYRLDLKIGNKVQNKLIAFYLPQFHETPYNNKWWGKGFTEWNNVKRGVPMYNGHNQPRIPSKLGYYDLSNFDNQIKQISLAKKFNVFGFCYYYYWFEGKRLLDKPLNNFLSHKEIDYPFCICWANETWSRRWDGQDHDILMQQNHNDETDEKFILDMIPILKDERYIKINDCPILLVYQANLFNNPKGTFNKWKKICNSKGVPNLKIGIVQSFLSIDHHTYGADFSVEFPPHKVASSENDCTNVVPIEDFNGIIYSYKDVVDNQELISRAPYDLKPGIMLEWDNTARKMKNAIIYSNFSPSLYKKWAIKNQLYNLIYNYEDKVSFINAWNEWAEGSYLEPDKKYGTKLLEITDEVLRIY